MVTAGFDIHEVHHRVKLLCDDGDTMLVEDRDDVTCPACGDDFSQLLISDRAVHSSDVDADIRFCVRWDGDRLLVAVHE